MASSQSTSAFAFAHVRARVCTCLYVCLYPGWKADLYYTVYIGPVELCLIAVHVAGSVSALYLLNIGIADGMSIARV